VQLTSSLQHRDSNW